MRTKIRSVYSTVMYLLFGYQLGKNIKYGPVYELKQWLRD